MGRTSKHIHHGSGPFLCSADDYDVFPLKEWDNDNNGICKKGTIMYSNSSCSEGLILPVLNRSMMRRTS